MIKKVNILAYRLLSPLHKHKLNKKNKKSFLKLCYLFCLLQVQSIFGKKLGDGNHIEKTIARFVEN